MPNSVVNRLAVEGTEEDVQQFVERIVSKELDRSGKPYVLDFEAHVPIPPEVRQDEAEGGEDIHQWVFDAWGSKQPSAPHILERSSGRVVYLFTTPVSVPSPWVQTMARLEPALTFEHESLGDFADFGGRTRYEAGERVSDEEVYYTELEWAERDDDEDE